MFTPYNLENANESMYLGAFSQQNNFINNRRIVAVRGLQENFLDRAIRMDNGKPHTVKDEMLDHSRTFTDPRGVETIVYPFLGFERTPRTRTFGEWLIITTKGTEEAANHIFDSVMAAHVENTPEYLEARALDGAGAYGIQRLNGGKGRADPLLEGYSLEMGAYLASHSATQLEGPQSPKRQPKAKPAPIQLTVCDTSEFPVLQQVPAVNRSANANHWNSGNSVRSNQSQGSGNNPSAASSVGSGNSSNAMDNISVITMETISSLFSQFADQQKKQFDDYSEKQDKKLETIVRMSLESTKQQMDGMHQEQSGKDRVFEKMVETSQSQVAPYHNH